MYHRNTPTLRQLRAFRPAPPGGARTRRGTLRRRSVLVAAAVRAS
jgi:hypothetical protein